MKFVLPDGLSYNKAVSQGFKSAVINALCFGGDRWFVYTLYIIFLLLIPVRNLLKNPWISLGLIVVLIVVYFLHFLPPLFALNNVFLFMIYFVVGYALSEYYLKIKSFALRYWWLIFVLGVFVNGVFIMYLVNIPFAFRFVLPFTGTLAMMTLAFKLEKAVERNKVVQYIEYCGKYSLQFYLFTFCYPFIRVLIVSVMHISNPFVIIVSVFVLQLITTTIIVEITRRIKWLKIPCGY